MDLKLGDVQTTALIPLAIKASETMRPKARIKDEKAVEIIRALNVDPAPYDKFMSHEGIRLVEEHSFNEEMKKYSIRGKLFALLLPKMNNRWATFAWG